MKSNLALLAGLLLTLTSNPAGSANTAVAGTRYGLNPQQSQLEFRFTQAGAETGGRFATFTVLLGLDPKGQPATLQVTIDVNSLDTKDAERDALLRGAELFDVAKYPQARFSATRIVAKGADRYEAAGELSIRNVRKARTVALRLSRGPDRKPLKLSGETTISRLAFGVGQGDWRSTEWVGDPVKVRFNLALLPQAVP